MTNSGFTARHRTIGMFAAWAIFVLGVLYAIVLALGLLSLESPRDPIGDPYFTMMELLIILMAPLLVIAMVAVHAYAAPGVKAYSLTALAMMIAAAGITTGVHFVILTVSRPIAAAGLSGAPLLFSFEWPSVAYALDILAWDVFFALSVLFAAPAFRTGRLERTVRILLIVTGVLSLAGLIGVPLADMQARLIGVVGYAGVSPIAFLLIAVVFRRASRAIGNRMESLDPI